MNSPNFKTKIGKTRMNTQNKFCFVKHTHLKEVYCDYILFLSQYLAQSCLSKIHKFGKFSIFIWLKFQNKFNK